MRLRETPETDANLIKGVGFNELSAGLVRADFARKLERERDAALEAKPDTQVALLWCVSWLDTLSDHLRGEGLAGEMLGELSRKRRESPALDESFTSIGWTQEAESNFFKARMIPAEAAQ